MSEDSQRAVPMGARKVLNWVKSHYGDIPLYVTLSTYENETSKTDKERVSYLKDYMNEVLKGMFL